MINPLKVKWLICPPICSDHPQLSRGVIHELLGFIWTHFPDFPTTSCWNLQVVQRDLEKFNLVNCTTALHRYAKAVHGHGLSALRPVGCRKWFHLFPPPGVDKNLSFWQTWWLVEANIGEIWGVFPPRWNGIESSGRLAKNQKAKAAHLGVVYENFRDPVFCLGSRDLSYMDSLVLQLAVGFALPSTLGHALQCVFDHCSSSCSTFIFLASNRNLILGHILILIFDGSGAGYKNLDCLLQHDICSLHPIGWRTEGKQSRTPSELMGKHSHEHSHGPPCSNSSQGPSKNEPQLKRLLSRTAEVLQKAKGKVRLEG